MASMQHEQQALPTPNDSTPAAATPAACSLPPALAFLVLRGLAPSSIPAAASLSSLGQCREVQAALQQLTAAVASRVLQLSTNLSDLLVTSSIVSKDRRIYDDGVDGLYPPGEIAEETGSFRLGPLQAEFEFKFSMRDIYENGCSYESAGAWWRQQLFVVDAGPDDDVVWIWDYAEDEAGHGWWLDVVEEGLSWRLNLREVERLIVASGIRKLEGIRGLGPGQVWSWPPAPGSSVAVREALLRTFAASLSRELFARLPVTREETGGVCPRPQDVTRWILTGQWATVRPPWGCPAQCFCGRSNCASRRGAREETSSSEEGEEDGEAA